MIRNLGTLSASALASLPLDHALERTGLGLAACDAEGRLTLLNSVLQEMFAVDFSEVAEADLSRAFNLLSEDGVTPLDCQEIPLVRSRQGEYVRDALLTARCPDGSLIHLRCNSAPLVDDDGHSSGAVVLVQDVTREREAARAEEQRQHRVVETINHEFRTPLAALIGHLELIRDQEAELPPELAKSLAAIERAGWRLRDLVDAATELVEVGVRPHRY